MANDEGGKGISKPLGRPNGKYEKEETAGTSTTIHTLETPDDCHNHARIGSPRLKRNQKKNKRGGVDGKDNKSCHYRKKNRQKTTKRSRYILTPCT
jgi:hypothetical protein